MAWGVGVLIFLGGIALLDHSPAASTLLCLIGIVITMGAIFISTYWAFRCPGCGRSLGKFVWSTGLFGPSDPPFRFCPFCGAELAARKTLLRNDDLLS
jgi:predicted RNA-binding Zn-ribbon protein involved in translation (DUF1610 family)